VQRILRQLKPILGGLPLIGVLFVLSLVLAKQIIKYSPTRYLTIAKIKLDTRKYGVSNDMLYKDFDIFTSENKIETEAEILGSHLLIKRALSKVKFNNQIKRIGKISTTHLYNNSPFSLKSEMKNDLLFDAAFKVVILDSMMSLTNKDLKIPLSIQGKLNEWMVIGDNRIMLSTNDTLIENDQLDLNGKYGFTFYSEEGIINNVRENLQVKAVDKEMTILRVVFTDEIPQKAADFNNALCQAYMDDYVSMKSYAANKTVDFIDLKLAEVGNDLEKAEYALEQYKLQNDVVNVRQETETGIRQIADLQVQLVNTMIEEKAILDLEQYLDSGDYFSEKAVHVGFGDLLLTELIKKLNNLVDTKRDLMLLFTESSDEVITVNAKIEEITFYINEAIRSNKNNIKTKRGQLEQDLEVFSHQFDDIPKVERRLQVLKREFSLQESVFNFLSQKRIEAFIASTSSTSFHRIIQRAYLPTEPVSPNKTLITFVCGLLGLIIGIAIVFLRRVSESKILDRDDIEKNSLLPLSGYITKSPDQMGKDYQTVMQSLLLKDHLKKHQLITITATARGEGKTEAANQVLWALIAKGHSACLVDYDIAKEARVSLDSELNFLSVNIQKLTSGDVITTRNDRQELAKNTTLLDSKLEELRVVFDFVVINSAPIDTHIEPVEMMKKSGITFFVFKANVSQIESVKNINLLTDEYKLQNLHLFLTGVNQSVNYSGNYVNQEVKIGNVIKKWISKLGLNLDILKI
jgi:uncharacterized protein involved in exopolysaccharide biosynthesis